MFLMSFFGNSTESSISFLPPIPNWTWISFVRTSFIKVNFPEPETPDITTRFSSGISTSMFLKLFCLAPLIWINSLAFRRLSGTLISSFPVRYYAVSKSEFLSSLKFPAKTSSPPKITCSGPIWWCNLRLSSRLHRVLQQSRYFLNL